jgi:GT2 family glycosyltransferase
MSTAVINIDLENLKAAPGGLEGRSHAFVVFRWGGQPVGSAFLTVSDGHIPPDALNKAIREVAGRNLVRVWAESWFAETDEARTDDGGGEMPRATVAICTRDRPDDLRRALEALSRLPDNGVEILVVDNCPSTDATKVVLREFPSVRYVLEPRPGLDIARNRALREASHEIVAFTDDDAVPEPGWLGRLSANFRDPRVMCVTGLVLPLELETEAQEWFERCSSFVCGFERRVFDAGLDSPLNVGRIGAGASMALRREIVEKIGWFDEALDAGTPAKSGGDHELFIRILAYGFKIVYEPRAVSWHRHRRSWKELRQALHGYGVGLYALLAHELFVEGELGVFRRAWTWFRRRHLPELTRSILRRPGAIPPSLLLSELTGCMWGPVAYLWSRRRAARLRRKYGVEQSDGKEPCLRPSA